ncbi:MAG: SpoIIE family protein phosphatase [candidate division KSB1 bacterium]|nr:SpoIIE family protein phosphatase [candidate division KSB1 bacterium]MDZ7393627.1 SpoIIE family protein phosphatase [candidate division KSB1 bacterium]
MLRTPIKEQLVVPAHIDYLADIRDFVAKIGQKYGFSKQVINAFKLSIDEATTNIIKHAYRDWEGSITVRAIVKRNSLTFVLIDQGKYFDPRRVQPPDLKRYVSIGKKGGLGIFIMRRLLDSIDYRKTEEGNELRLTKRREPVRARRLHLPTLSLSLKARYSAIACAAVTLIVTAGYLYFYSQEDDNALREVLGRGVPMAQTLTTSIAGDIKGEEIDFTTEVSAGEKIQSTVSKFPELVVECFMVDSAGTVRAASVSSPLLYTQFAPPARLRRVDENTVIFAWEGQEVIDISYPLHAQETGKVVGYTHLWLRKKVADSLAASRRAESLRLALIVLAIGVVGTFLLVYVVLNPFRKLAQWVRTLGHEEVEDELDIDASTELGEIAQAFSDITTKLRESQKNLAEQERLRKEMQVAQEIQRTLLPTELPKIEGFSVATFYEAAKEVGGDYFDFVEVDRDTLGIAVADVSGKGVPGSLVMTMIRTALRTEARGVYSAAEVLARVNDFVINDMKKGMFVTVFYAILDSKRRRINYASAGHNPMILYRGATRKTYYLNPQGFPIGIALPEKDLFRRTIQSDTIRLAPDDILILYTDGITEAMNPQREMFGDERLLQVVRDYSHLPVDAFVEQLKNELHSFTEGNPQSDDITLVAIKEQASAESIELERAKRAYRLLEAGRSLRDACAEAGISIYAMSKYRRLFEERGVEAVEVDASVLPVEARHLSIEEKTKIYDIIREHPEYGAKRIAEELATEKYGFESIPEAAIYEELVRSRLNTRQLREAFVARRGTARRMKPPGTPLLTLDGRVIIEKPQPLEVPLVPVRPPAGKGSKGEEPPGRPAGPVKKPTTPRAEVTPSPEPEAPAVALPDVELEKLLTEPIEELLSKPAAASPDLGEEEATVAPEPAEVEDLAATPATSEEAEGLIGGDEWLELLASAEEGGLTAAEQTPAEEEYAPPSDHAGPEVEEAGFAFEELEQFWEESPPPPAAPEEELLPERTVDADDQAFAELLEALEEPVPDEGGNGRQDTRPHHVVEGKEVPPPRPAQRQPDKVLREKVLLKGLRLYHAERYDEAIAEFRRVVEEYPDFKEAHSILGNAYFRNRMYLEAAEEYRKVKEIDDTDPDAYENMGVIYANRGEFEKAIAEWQMVLRLDPSRKDIEKNIERAQRLLAKRGRPAR